MNLNQLRRSGSANSRWLAFSAQVCRAFQHLKGNILGSSIFPREDLEGKIPQSSFCRLRDLSGAPDEAQGGKCQNTSLMKSVLNAIPRLPVPGPKCSQTDSVLCTRHEFISRTTGRNRELDGSRWVLVQPKFHVPVPVPGQTRDWLPPVAQAFQKSKHFPQPPSPVDPGTLGSDI